jgi:hypothetical protein
VVVLRLHVLADDGLAALAQLEALGARVAIGHAAFVARRRGA